MISRNTARRAGFEIIGTAPAGGSARVYKSRHILTGEICALKLPADDVDATIIRTEAYLLSQLDHPSIVRLFASGDIDSSAWLATRWIEGVQLTELLKRSNCISETRAIRLLTQIVSALQYAHDKGVVHADISPSNIILDADDNITLLDFGISRQTDIATISAKSDFTGTLRYVSPEVIEGKKACAASDQYSVAIVIYELLTGLWPYNGQANAASALHSHLYAEMVNIQERNPTVSSIMDNVLTKSLRKDPLTRFENIADMTKALTDEPVCLNYCNAGTSIRSAFHAKNIFRSQDLRKLFVPLSLVIVISSVVIYQNVSTNEANHSMLLSDSHAGEIDNSCNMFKPPVANNAEVVENFYGGIESPEQIRLILKANNQWHLQIGKSNEYGLYGQIIKVESDQKYLFSATIENNGYLHMPALRIEWLDAEYQALPDSMIEYGIAEHNDGLVSMPVVEVPKHATYAVPTVYKDASEGTMVVSSLYFHDVNCHSNVSLFCKQCDDW